MTKIIAFVILMLIPITWGTVSLIKSKTHEYHHDDLVKYKGLGGRVLQVGDKHLVVITMSGEKEFPKNKCRYLGRAGEVSASTVLEEEDGLADLLFVCAFWLFITPVGWGIMLLVVLGTIQLSISSTISFHRRRKEIKEHYTKEDCRRRLLDALLPNEYEVKMQGWDYEEEKKKRGITT